MKLLVVLVIVLAVLAIKELMRVYELSSDLKGGRNELSTDEDNKKMGAGMLIFFAAFMVFVFWEIFKYKDKLLPEAASLHGVETDWLLNFNFIIIFVPFIIVHVFLAYFAWKYSGKTGYKASFFAHNNRLEMIWTVIPAIVLTVVIVLGLRLWNKIQDNVSPETQVIQLYAKQFDWTARYAGKDNTLGKASFRLIEGANELGVDMNDKNAADDIVAKGEFHLVVNKPVEFKLNAREVIHSAYMPHFRAQMNCVPGMTTRMSFTPTITSAEMRKKLNNPKFDYVLLCNKICGATHYNMQMNVIVETQQEYDKWIAEQKTLAVVLAPAPAATPEAVPVAEEMKTDSAKVAVK